MENGNGLGYYSTGIDPSGQFQGARGARVLEVPRGGREKSLEPVFKERFQKAVFQIVVSITRFKKAIFKT